MAVSRPLVEGKIYHFNVIYNHALSRYSATPDTELSLRFVEFLVGKLTEWGYTEFYYYDEHALPGRNVFEELFRVVNGSQWSFVILTKEFSSNCWVKYCQMAAFKNLIDKTQRDKLIPITVGNVQLPVELDVNGVLSFDDDQTTWGQGHIRQLNRLQRVLAENISVAAASEVEAVQDHGDGRVRSERDHIITETQPSIQESPSDINLNSHMEVDGSMSFDNTDGSTHHPNANDGIEEMGQNADMNPARTSNQHYPQSVLAISPTTDTATNIQGEKMQTDTGVKKTSVSITENRPNRTSELEHNLSISSARPMFTNASPNSEGLIPQDSASQGRTTFWQLDQTEYKANTQASSEFSIHVSSLAREATSRIAMVESGPTIKMEHIYNSHRSGKPLNSSEGQSSLQSVRGCDIDATTVQDSVDGLTVEEIVNTQCDVTSSVAAGCIPRPELSEGKIEQNKDVDRLAYEAEYPEQRMKELLFDRGGQYVDNLSLSEDQDITLDQERSNLQCENISTTGETRPEVLFNDFTQRIFELEEPTLNIDSLINNVSNEQEEFTEPKHITSSSDAGYISADNLSNNSIFSSHPGKHHKDVHTDSNDGMDVKPSSLESNPKTCMGNSKYSGDVKSGNNQMYVVDLMKKERLVCTREKESKPEKVTDNKNKDEEVPVRGERPRPVGSEADASFSLISTSRSVARDIDGYREVFLRSLFHSLTKTDMLSSWS